MSREGQFDEFSADAQELAGLEPTSVEFAPLADRLLKFVERAVEDTEALRRCRETSARMGRREPERTEPANFPYTIHTS